MVYCTKCGTLNSETANNCIKCGAPLKAGSTEPEFGPYWRRRYESNYHRGGAGLGALVFGIIIILVGLSFLISEVYNIYFPWWPIILILIGVWILFVGFRRSRRLSSSQSARPQ